MNCWYTSIGTQFAPMRTPISPAPRSWGWTASKASTCLRAAGFWLSGAASRKAFAIRSLRRTFPERYSSAVTGEKACRLREAPRSLSGFSGPSMLRKITPESSASSSSGDLPESWAIYSMSTRAFSAIETARASLAVSTLVTATWGRMVRLVNISAFLFRLPSSSSTSREHKRQ